MKRTTLSRPLAAEIAGRRRRSRTLMACAQSARQTREKGRLFAKSARLYSAMSAQAGRAVLVSDPKALNHRKRISLLCGLTLELSGRCRDKV
jgi:hypothetical protein